MENKNNWFIILDSTTNQMDLSPTFSDDSKVLEEFQTFLEAKEAFKFYENFLSK